MEFAEPAPIGCTAGTLGYVSRWGRWGRSEDARVMVDINTKTRRADYGLDSPGLVTGLIAVGAGLIGAGIALLMWAQSLVLVVLGNIVIWPGAICLAEGALMIWSSKVGKLRVRDRMLDRLALRGDEQVLDLGCGHGLLLIGAARRLPRGKAVGIDIWSQVDQANNSRTATLENARREGVTDRVEVHDGDMRRLPFDDDRFDAVVAGLAIHNLYQAEDRRRAIAEAVRVLRPGGRVSLMDIRHVREYARALQAEAMLEVRVSGPIFWVFPPVWIVTARRPELTTLVPSTG